MSQKKRELEQNELADVLGTNLERIKPWMPRIILITSAIVLGILAVAVWNWSYRSANEGQWEEYLDSTRFADIRAMDEVARIFPDTTAGQLALIRAADYDFTRGSLSMISDRDEFQDKVRKAIERYEKLVSGEHKVDTLLQRRAMYALGHCYETLGNFDKAREYYGRLVEEAPNEPVAKLAREGLDRLADPAIVAIYEQFRSWQPETTAPGGGPLLPPRPNLDVPAAPDASPPAPVPQDGEDGAENPAPPESGEAPQDTAEAPQETGEAPQETGHAPEDSGDDDGSGG
jgi:tetratricopeptide (TPR) repeat protein